MGEKEAVKLITTIIQKRIKTLRSIRISNCVQFVMANGISEDLLFGMQLRDHCRNIFIGHFYASTKKYNEDWSKCVGICINGAKATTRYRFDFIVTLLEVIPNVSYIHICLHREAPTLKFLLSEMRKVTFNSIVQ